MRNIKHGKCGEQFDLDAQETTESSFEREGQTWTTISVMCPGCGGEIQVPKMAQVD